VGKGHKIAFNILNIGRFKLAVGCTGGAKLALRRAVEYANARTAFGRPVSDFGLVRHKLGEMAIRIYAAESMVYRTAGMMDSRLAGADLRDPAAVLAPDRRVRRRVLDAEGLVLGDARLRRGRDRPGPRRGGLR
jgi:alkylation response protein AidB-like acyl-CoA dehydrogenase